MNAPLMLPRRSRGRQSPEGEYRYRAEREAFCRLVLENASRVDFRVSSRGHCYLLEEHGLGKGDFDAAGRELCRQAILKYVPAGAIAAYERKLLAARSLLQAEIAQRLQGGGRP